VVVPRLDHPRASPSARVAAPFRVPRIPARAAGESAFFARTRKRRAFFARTSCAHSLSENSYECQSAIRFLVASGSAFPFHFIHVRRREAKERRSVAVSSAAHGATLTARRRRRTRDTHRTMFAVHSFATHSSAAAFRPSLRRYAPRRPPPIARATWPTHSTLASVDGPPRTESPRASRRPPRTRLALSRDSFALALTPPSSRRAGRPPSAAAAPFRSARAPSPRTTSRLA
jgi:hypothetical protein